MDEECENESEDAKKQLDLIETASVEIDSQKLAISSLGALQPRLLPRQLPLLLHSGPTGHNGLSALKLAVMEK